MKKAIRIQIIEDYALIRNSLMQFLNKENNLIVTDCYANVGNYLDGATEQKPDILIVDLNFLGSNGKDEIKKLKTISPNTQIAILLRENSKEDINELTNAGAKEYFSLEDSYEIIVNKLKNMFKKK